METAVTCDIKECKYNGGKFCKKIVVIMNGGICGELVDKKGNRRDPSLWVKEEFKTPQNNG